MIIKRLPGLGSIGTVCVVAAAMGLTQTAQANDERIEALQQQLNDLRYQVEDLSSQLEDEGDDVERFSWGAFPEFSFDNFEQQDAAFAGAVELFADMQLGDRVRGRLQLEVAGTSVDEEEELEIELEQAYLEYAVSNQFKPTLGVVLIPWGRYNKNHFATVNNFDSRPLVFEHVTPGVWKEAGLGFSGWSGLSDTLAINYEAYIVNGLPATWTDNGGPERHGRQGGDNNNNKAFVGRAGFEINNAHEIGLSAYIGSYSADGEDSVSGAALDFLFKVGPVELTGEYVAFDFDQGVVTAEFAGGEAEIAAPEELYGYYVEAGWYLTRQWIVSARYGFVHLDDDGDNAAGDAAGTRADADNEEERVTVGVTWRPQSDVRFTLEYLDNNTENEVIEYGDASGFIFSTAAYF